MDQFVDYVLNLLSQFAGGPGPAENNLVRYGLPAIFWAVLLYVAWSRQRYQERPRESLLLWGFALGLLRELFLFVHMSVRIVTNTGHDALCAVTEPVEHALTVGSLVVIAGAYIRYIKRDARLSRTYVRAGLLATAACYLATFWWWARHLAANPQVRFHQTWSAWVFHIASCVFLAIAIYHLARERGWLPRVVVVALSFFFLGEFLVLVNYGTDKAYSNVLCPIANSFHIWAIPLLGYVYFREQSIEKQRTEDELRAYRDHLEELVEDRTAELTAQNAVAATISQSLELATILNAALDRTLGVLEVEAGCIFLLDPDQNALTLEVYRGADGADTAADVQRQCLCEEISSQAVNSMGPVIRDIAGDPGECPAPLMGGGDLQVMVGIPLISKGRAVGAMTLGAACGSAFQPQELDLLTAIGQQIGMAVENAHLYQETERWAAGMALLHELSVFLSSTLDPVTIYDQITDQSAKLLGCSATVLFRWDEERQEAVGVSGYGPRGIQFEGTRLTAAECPPLPDLIAHRQSIAIDDAQQDPRVPAAWREILDVGALLCVSLRGTGGPLGFLFLIDGPEPRRWRADEVDLVESFVNRAAIALENAHLHKQLEWAAALEERQRIAANMHDGLAQTLSVLGLKTDQASELLDAGRVKQVVDALHTIRETIGQATKEVRLSIASLQESPQPRQPLQDWLVAVIEEVGDGGEPPIQLVSRFHQPLFLPPERLEQVLRVVQEGLVNARRHSQAGHITVLLAARGDEVRVSIEDDGRGFDPAEPALTDGDHFGMSIMRARAARIGGRISIESAPGEGTRVILTWPRNGRVEALSPDSTRRISVGGSVA